MTEPTSNDDAAGEIQVAVLAQGDGTYLKELADVLTEASVEHDIVAPPGCDTGSCGPTLYLVTPPEQLQQARAALEAHWNAQLDPNELAAVETVVDMDAELATCPACATPFATSASRCPECGLNFGG